MFGHFLTQSGDECPAIMLLLTTCLEVVLSAAEISNPNNAPISLKDLNNKLKDVFGHSNKRKQNKIHHSILQESTGSCFVGCLSLR